MIHQGVPLQEPMKVKLRGGYDAVIKRVDVGPAPWFCQGEILHDRPSPDTWRKDGRWHESGKPCRYDIMFWLRPDGSMVAFHGLEIQPLPQP